MYYFIVLIFITTASYAEEASWNSSLYLTTQDTDCQSIYLNNQPLMEDRDLSTDADIFTCALVTCAKESNYGVKECQWFRQLSHQEDFRDIFQDLKNYLAQIDLDMTKHKVANKASELDFGSRGMVFSIKSAFLEQKLDSMMLQFDVDTIVNNFLLSSRDATDLIFVLNHFNFCSRIENSAGFCARNSLYQPDDLLTASALSPQLYSSPLQINAAKRFVINATSPVPIPLSKPSSLFTSAISPKHIKYNLTDNATRHLTVKMRYSQLVSLAQQVLIRAVAQRIPSVELISESGYDRSADDSFFESLVGIYGQKKMELEYRLIDPSWTSRFQTLSTDSIYKEIDRMQAISLMSGTEMLLHLENYESMMAVEVALMLSLKKQSPELKSNPVEDYRVKNKKIRESYE